MDKREAMLEVSKLVEKAKTMLSCAKEIAEQHDIPFTYQMTAAASSEDDWDSSNCGEDIEWNSSSCW